MTIMKVIQIQIIVLNGGIVKMEPVKYTEGICKYCEKQTVFTKCLGKAFSEIARVKKGGMHIFTVPMMIKGNTIPRIKMFDG